MKIKHLFLFGMTALAVGCTDQSDEMPRTEQPADALQIQINGNIEQQYLARVNDNGFCEGDQVGLYGVNYTDNNNTAGTLWDEGNQVDNICYTYDEENRTWTSKTPAYYKDVNTHIDLYAYYPYGVPTSTSAYEFEVEKDQNFVDGYAASDFLWAKSTKVVPSENKVLLPFTHRMSCANVILQEGSGFEEGTFAALQKSVLVLNTTRTSTIDLSTGVVTATGNATSEGTVMMESSDGFRAIVVPQTVGANVALFAITVDGTTYHFKQEAAFTYEAGKQNKFTITVNRKETADGYEFKLTSCEIVDWIADIETHGGEARQYYVVNVEEAGTLGALIKANGKNPDKIKNLKVVGKIHAGDFDFMRDSMEILQAINLKECVIEAATWVYCNINNEGYHYEYIDGYLTDNNEIEAALKQKYPNAATATCSGYSPYYGNTIPRNALKGKTSLVHFVFPEYITKIEEYAFYGTLLSDALIIPDDVIEIGSYAFSGTNITSLSLPNNIKEISNNSFAYCNSLVGSLNLPESLEKIGPNCFTDCSGLTGTIKIPLKVTTITFGCFYGCKGFTELIIPEGITTIESSAFYGCESLTGNLNLPESIKSIGGGAFSMCDFQGELVIPSQIIEIEETTFYGCGFSSIVFSEELIKIGRQAFYYNKNLCSVLDFPESLLTIEEYAFGSCSTLQGIVFPSKLATIQNNAFYGCESISSITSKAIDPGTVIGSNAFYNVPKDAFIVQVPEESIIKYQTANGWKDFMYGAYYNFSISSALIRTLNAEYKETLTLTVPDNYTWSIEKQPDWVSVSPATGTGTTEVIVTINELAKGSENRTDTVKFLLDGKDCRSNLVIEQYNYDYADGDIIVEQEAAEGKDGVDLVFMGDCFDALDICNGKYLEKIREGIKHFFEIEPYASYKNYFNIYIVIGMSPDSGMGTEHSHKRSKFGSKYYAASGIELNPEKVFEYACKGDKVSKDKLSQTLIVMIENTSEYGSVSYLWDDGSAISICPISENDYPFDFRGVIQHEAGGHGFGKLGDENKSNTEGSHFESNTAHGNKFHHAKKQGWYANLSTEGNMSEVNWSHLMFHENYKNIVDMYEGGYFHQHGIYRSEDASCMDNNIPYYSTISRQSIVERIKKYAGEEYKQEDFYEKDKKGTYTESRAAQQDAEEVYTQTYRQRTPKFMGSKPNFNK